MSVHPPDVARRNLVLGFILGGLCLAITVAFMIIFTRHGLPQDPKEVKRLEQEQAARTATMSQAQ